MSFSLPGKQAFALVGCAALCLSAAACSPSTSDAGGGPTGSPTMTTAPSTANPDAGLPTGAQLKADLLDKGIPAGYVLDPGGSVDTGSYYQASSTAATSCANLGGTSWVLVAGHSAASFAQNDYIDKSTAEEFAQEIDAYRGTTARDVMTALSRIGAKCPSFTDSQTSSTVKVSVATAGSPGDGAVVITLSDSRWVGTTTLEAVRVGDCVVTVLSSADSGSAAFAKSTASQIVARLAAAGKQ